uniref:Immunoglobulin (CD79A) binding protein 1 n=1 Tax=Callorhinchus milii TaxID=7868 RepID=A0A4W3JEN7_CALMI
MASSDSTSSGVRNSNIIIIGGRGGEAPSLSDMFEGGWRALEEAETSDQPSNSNGFQYTVRRGSPRFRVNPVKRFDRNEELEEIATADVKYLLLPALLGALTMKLSNSAKRLEHVQKARIYFTDFLKRCKDYNVMVFELPKTEENSDDSSKALARPTAPAAISQPSLLSMAASRQSKIERYNQKKETEAKLKEINSLVSSGKADDELTRTFYGLNLKRWISISIEEIESIDQEIQILKRMIGVKRQPQPPRPQRAPMPPFILTRNAAQAKVFGAGYPSLATMTVDDWYEEHKKHSMLPDQGIPRGRPGKTDADDEQALRNAREKDEWKDTHRRGYGNRHNMG